MGQYFKPVFLKDKDDAFSPEVVQGYMKSWSYSNGSKLMEHSYIGNDFVGAVESLLAEGAKFYQSRIAWAGDYASNEEGIDNNLYGLCEHSKEYKPRVPKKTFRYVINHSKKEFVDKHKVPPMNDGWKIHPLPLLTRASEQGGGGDYRGEENIIGSWARDEISVSNNKPEGFDEILFEITE